MLFFPFHIAFGSCNAPSTFQQLMQRMLGDQQGLALLLYLDDIVVYSSVWATSPASGNNTVGCRKKAWKRNVLFFNCRLVSWVMSFSTRESLQTPRRSRLWLTGGTLLTSLNRGALSGFCRPQATAIGVRPVAYASRGLQPTERNMSNYSSVKMEFLALTSGQWPRNSRIICWDIGAWFILITL